MTKETKQLLENEVKEFILANPVLNHREIVRSIQWSPSSFSLWLNSESKNKPKPIPVEKLRKLKEFLEVYGLVTTY